MRNTKSSSATTKARCSSSRQRRSYKPFSPLSFALREVEELKSRRTGLRFGEIRERTLASTKEAVAQLPAF